MTLLPVQVIWTNYLSPDYSLFIALAILEREKMALFQPTNDFSDILEVRREGVGERKGGREGGREGVAWEWCEGTITARKVSLVKEVHLHDCTCTRSLSLSLSLSLFLSLSLSLSLSPPSLPLCCSTSMASPRRSLLNQLSN